MPADHAAQLALTKNSCSNFWDRLRERVSVVILPQSKAWVELEPTGGSEWEVEVAQAGEAGAGSTEAAAGMRGEAVSFKGEEKIKK